MNRPAQSAIHSIDDLFDSSTLLLDKQLYDDGIPNLSSARNIATYALEASGVDINSMSVTQQNDFIQVCHALAENLNNFDVTKPCALCGDVGHTFSECTTTQPPVLQQNFIKLRLLVNRFRKQLQDYDKALNLNMFRTVNINHLDSVLPSYSHHLQASPLHSVGSSPSSSGGVIRHSGGAVPSAGSLNQQDRKQLNSLFGNIEATLKKQGQALAEQNAIISNISSVMSSNSPPSKDDDSSTLGGQSDSTGGTLGLFKGETDFRQGRYI